MINSYLAIKMPIIVIGFSPLSANKSCEAFVKWETSVQERVVLFLKPYISS